MTHELLLLVCSSGLSSTNCAVFLRVLSLIALGSKPTLLVDLDREGLVGCMGCKEDLSIILLVILNCRLSCTLTFRTGVSDYCTFWGFCCTYWLPSNLHIDFISPFFTLLSILLLIICLSVFQNFIVVFSSSNFCASVVLLLIYSL